MLREAETVVIDLAPDMHPARALIQPRLKYGYENVFPLQDEKGEITKALIVVRQQIEQATSAADTPFSITTGPMDLSVSEMD